MEERRLGCGRWPGGGAGGNGVSSGARGWSVGGGRVGRLGRLGGGWLGGG